MDEAGGLFRVMDIRDAVGAMADDEPVDPRLVPARARGRHRAVPDVRSRRTAGRVDISGCGLLNVGTEELIWPRHPDDDGGDDDAPLRVLTDVSSGSGPVCGGTRNNPAVGGVRVAGGRPAQQTARDHRGLAVDGAQVGPCRPAFAIGRLTYECQMTSPSPG